MHQRIAAILFIDVLLFDVVRVVNDGPEVAFGFRSGGQLDTLHRVDELLGVGDGFPGGRPERFVRSGCGLRLRPGGVRSRAGGRRTPFGDFVADRVGRRRHEDVRGFGVTPLSPVKRMAKPFPLM